MSEEEKKAFENGYIIGHDYALQEVMKVYSPYLHLFYNDVQKLKLGGEDEQSD